MKHLRRLRNLFRRDLDSDIQRELEFHIAERVDELVASGVDERDAHYEAHRQFGNPMVLRERTRDVNLMVWLEELAVDIRLAFRRLRKEPGFTLMALLSLGLGIGANTAVYTLINGVMLKQLPVREPQQLVSWGLAENSGVQDGLTGSIDIFAYDFAYDMETNREMFADTASYGSFPVAVSARTSASRQASRAITQLVSGRFFSVLGVQPLLGRTFNSTDAEAPGKNPVVVLSFDYWQHQFSADPTVIGKAVIVNGSPFEVVGVAPERFFGVSLDVFPDMWIPATMQQQVTLRDSWLGPHSLYWMHMISRMRPGASLGQAREWASIQLRRDLTARSGASLSAGRMKEIRESYVDVQPGGRGTTALRSQYGEPLRILIGVTGVVLLIACVNLASFSLARMASREKEIFARLALGAGRYRIVRQVLTEGMVLSVLGGLAGLTVASWAAAALIHFVIRDGERTPLDPAPDLQVLTFTFAASILTGLLFSIVPALRASYIDIASRLRVSSRSVMSDSSRPGRLPLSRILVAVQVALSLVLLAGAGLFVQTLRNFDRQGFGFNRQTLISVAGTPGQWRIVGVAADGRYNNPRKAPPPMTYFPLSQLPRNDQFVTSLQLRTAGDAERMIGQARQAIAEVDPNVPVSRIETFVREADRFLSQERLISRLSSFFSMGALLLGCIGLYGVMSHSVARRAGEIGVRMALGAKASNIRSMILKEACHMLAAGIAIGVPASLLAARAVQSQLFGVGPFDPATLLLSVVVIAAVTFAAGWLPASRAAQVDPMTALRDE